MRRLLSFVLAALAVSTVLACEELGQQLAQQQGQAGSAGAGGKAPCDGFTDIQGNCLYLTCLGTPTCTNQTAKQSCGPLGPNGPATCLAGWCGYENSSQSCKSGAECPCGICGPNGHCYEDVGGGCGTCAKQSTGTGSDSVACKACMSDCAGTGPACCKGCGCICEGQCGVCK